MTIFKRENGAPAPSVQRATPVPEADRRITRIAPGSKITGEVNGSAELRIDGELHGKIVVDARVVVGEGGLVEGEISARQVTISGRVVGDVRGSEKVEVTHSGNLEGGIFCPRVVIAEGAFFKGQVEMQSDRGQGGRPKGGNRRPPGGGEA